jgi:ABC-type spermidine/putrescine transport system permease subunit II
MQKVMGSNPLSSTSFSDLCSIVSNLIQNLTVLGVLVAVLVVAEDVVHHGRSPADFGHDHGHLLAARLLLGQVVFNASVAMLITRARFVGMGDTLEEAAYDLGSGPLATFRQITLPRLMPAIVAAALLSFTFSFDDYVLPAFTNGTTNTWPIVLYSAVRFGLTPAVNALATIMLGVTVTVIVITALMLRRSRARASSEQDAARTLGAAITLR